MARRARDQLRRLDQRITDAVVSALTLLESDPQAGHVLRGRLKGLRAVRIGAYRILYELRDGSHTVRILSIRHREDAYAFDPRT